MLPEDLVTPSAYARSRGLSRATVLRAIEGGRITVLEGGLLDPVEADREWAANTDPQKGGGGSRAKRQGTSIGARRRGGPAPVKAPVGPTFNSVRTKHEQLRLELAQMDADERRGILVRADEVARQAFESAQRVKEAVLRVPAQLAAQMAATGDVGECRRLMAECLRAALRGAMDSADGEEGATDGDGG